MAIVLTKVLAQGFEASEPLQKQFEQMIVLQGTGAVGDVAYDIGNYTGTFWTAVGGTEPGITALKAFKDVQIAAQTLESVGGAGVVGSKTVIGNGTVATGEVKIALNGTNTKLADLTYFAGEGPTAWNFVFKWLLKPGVGPIECDAQS